MRRTISEMKEGKKSEERMGKRRNSKKPEGLPYGISPADKVSLFLECRVDGEGRIFADETTLTVLFSASFAGCIDEADSKGQQGCQMAKFDPFLSLDCGRLEGMGPNPRKGRDQTLQGSGAEP